MGQYFGDEVFDAVDIGIDNAIPSHLNACKTINGVVATKHLHPRRPVVVGDAPRSSCKPGVAHVFAKGRGIERFTRGIGGIGVTWVVDQRGFETIFCTHVG